MPTMARIVSTLLLYLSVSLPSLSTYGVTAASLQVDTTAGSFIGQQLSSGLDRWLGVPFAEPPVGSLRFKAPVPIIKPSQTVKNASTFGNACPQVPSDSLGAPMAEDCLFLNVSSSWSHTPNVHSHHFHSHRYSDPAVFLRPRNCRHSYGSM